MKFNLFVLIGAFLSTPWVSATPLFHEVEPDLVASPPPVYKAIFDVSINFEGLQQGPETLAIDLPLDRSFTIDLTEFIPRDGFEFSEQSTEMADTLTFSVLAGASQSDMSYMWSGTDDEHDVLITVHQGVLYAIINHSDYRYGVKRSTSGDYKMYEFDFAHFPPRDEFAEITPAPVTPLNVPTDSFVSHLKSHEFPPQHEIQGTPITGLDILIVWTEDARVAAGGDPGDANDTVDIDALMVAVTDHANTALSNSAMNTRLVMVHTAKYVGFTYTGEYEQDLLNLQSNLAIQDLRMQVGADTVMAIIGNDFQQFQVCGAAYVQTIPGCGLNIPGCNYGLDFKDHAYAITTELCSLWDDTFTHELGHNLGANHVPDEVPSGDLSAIEANGFPDAFGHRTSLFKTIMSVTAPTPNRRLYFSNPDVSVDGTDTGILGERNNARVIDELSPVVSTFGVRPVIFSDRFE